MLAIIIFVTLVLYSTACLGLGMLALRAPIFQILQSNHQSGVAKLATSFLLGQGFLANLWLLLALPGWLSPIVVTGTVSALALCGVILIWHLSIDLVAQLRSVWQGFWADTWAWKITYSLTIMLCLAWITSLGRILSLDGGAFHMALPKLISTTYQLSPLPGIYEDFTSIGLQAEMHFAALMSLGSPDAAQLFNWPTILAGSIMLLALARQVGLQRRGQWIVLAMLFSSSAVFWLSGFGKTDLFAAAFGLAAFYWTMQLRNVQRQSALWLVGLLSGFAIVAKITYIPSMAPGIVLLITWMSLINSKPKRKFSYSFLEVLPLMSGFLLAVTPHLIKNGIIFSDPIAPFGTEMPGWLNQSWHGQNTTLQILLTYPIAITFGDYYGQSGNLSVLVLAFLPLIIFLPRPKSLITSPLLAVSLAALVSILAWTAVRPVLFAPRYMLASLLLLTLPAARAAEYVSQDELKLRWLSNGVIASIGIMIVIVGLAYHNRVFSPVKTYQYLSGDLPECDRNFQFCDSMMVINNRAPLGSRVFVNSYQRYWLRSDLIQCLSTAGEIEDYLNLPTDKARWDFLYAHGFRYIIKYDNVGFVFQDIPIPNVETAPDWLSVGSEQVGLDVVMRLQARDFSHESKLDCYQQDERIWKSYSPPTNHR